MVGDFFDTAFLSFYVFTGFAEKKPGIAGRKRKAGAFAMDFTGLTEDEIKAKKKEIKRRLVAQLADVRRLTKGVFSHGTLIYLLT